ncbi:hypothetical protein JCM19237_1937 [Photobacterium aphoticum]|uniref:Uncharacterized protein n=1 Tax=Photobacterium aphoticum TaxID=754436 RepID=A0A090RFE7_9GAMM|nr:hypothetical protein JCM19237_1937 [Photobacterium aphoticum]
MPFIDWLLWPIYHAILNKCRYPSELVINALYLSHSVDNNLLIENSMN